jgi:hypothetical protein
MIKYHRGSQSTTKTGVVPSCVLKHHWEGSVQKSGNTTLTTLLYFHKCGRLYGIIRPGFFRADLPVVRMSPEWVSSPAQGKSIARIDTYNLWTSMSWDGISSIPVKTVTLL